MKNQHKTHKFNFINVCANINKEILDFLQQKSQKLHYQRQQLHSETMRQFKEQIRQSVIEMKNQSIELIEEASVKILSQLNRGEVKVLEREMELFQQFFNNKISNFC